MNGIDVGIDQLGVYLPRFALRLDRLAEARGVPVEKIHVGLGAQAMAVAPPWEDAVTLGANAAARVFRHGEVCPDEIGLLVVATETAVDHAKPASIFLHELLGLPASCRTFEIKHACYGGTAGVMLAADWVRSGAARGRKALVVATDIARYDLHSSAEFTQGAGATALVVSEAPRLLRLGTTTGVFAKNVYDFWRPLERRDYGQLPVAHADQDAQTIEAGLLFLPHVVVRLGAEERGVRIEGPQHAVDRAEDKVLVGDVGAVALVGDRDELGVELEGVPGLVGVGKEPVAEESAEGQGRGEEDDRDDAPGASHGKSLHPLGGGAI